MTEYRGAARFKEFEATAGQSQRRTSGGEAKPLPVQRVMSGALATRPQTADTVYYYSALQSLITGSAETLSEYRGDQMKLRIFLPLCVVCALLLVACAKSDETTNRAAPSSAAPNATPVAQKTAVLTSGEKIGVPECDDFLAAYEACVTGKVPEVARAQYKASLEQWRSSWKQLSGNPQTRASLVAACKQSAEQAKTSMTAFNCAF